MTREERCKLAIEKGYTYNTETGIVTGPSGKEITAKITGYINIQLRFNSKYFHLKAHQFAWYWVNKECVKCLDHINGVRDDNHICNLRSVTHQENHFNQTKAKGYCWDKNNNKWKVQIKLNEKQIFLGRFDNEKDARAAYLEAKEKYHII
jgi:hypothetical protein